MIHKRLRKVLVFSVIILVVGILYGAFVSYTGWGIPCLFYTVTGLQCPGCGVTHMCMALLQLDFKEAFCSHPILLILLPILLLIALKNLICYIRQGRSHVTRVESVILYVCIALLVGFSVYRNLPRLQQILSTTFVVSRFLN